MKAAHVQRRCRYVAPLTRIYERRIWRGKEKGPRGSASSASAANLARASAAAMSFSSSSRRKLLFAVVGVAADRYKTSRKGRCRHAHTSPAVALHAYHEAPPNRALTSGMARDGRQNAYHVPAVKHVHHHHHHLNQRERWIERWSMSVGEGELMEDALFRNMPSLQWVRVLEEIERELAMPSSCRHAFPCLLSCLSATFQPAFQVVAACMVRVGKML